MSSRGSRFAWACALASAASLTGTAAAHAPVVRRAHALRDGSTWVTVPGFGIVLGNEASGYAYLCAAALGAPLDDTDYAVLERSDGALFVGSGGGLRIRDAQGCAHADEATHPLHDRPISALAFDAAGRLLAALGGTQPRIVRVDAQAAGLETLAVLPEGLSAAALVVQGDEIAASLGAGSATQLVRVRAGNAVLTPQPDGLQLIAATGGAAPQVWGLVPTGAARNRGFQLVRAVGLDGPFEPRLYVDYFGGFSAAEGVLWVGDAGGHLYRSRDGGEQFEDVAPGLGASCVAALAGGVDTCALSSPRTPCLSRFDDARAELHPRLALADVAHLAECPGEDIASVCAAAWIEWNRDARLVGEDAGVPAVDGGAPVAAGAPSIPAQGLDLDAGAAPEAGAARVPSPRGTSSGGCALGAQASRESVLALALACALALLQRNPRAVIRIARAFGRARRRRASTRLRSPR